AGYRTAATAAVKSKNRSRPFYDLPQVPRERSEAAIFVRSRVGRGFRKLAKARADSGAPFGRFHPESQMGATQSNHSTLHRIVAPSRSGKRLDDLEHSNGPATTSNRNCRSAG